MLVAKTELVILYVDVAPRGDIRRIVLRKNDEVHIRSYVDVPNPLRRPPRVPHRQVCGL